MELTESNDADETSDGQAKCRSSEEVLDGGVPFLAQAEFRRNRETLLVRHN